jgi:hypothetical protein
MIESSVRPAGQPGSDMIVLHLATMHDGIPPGALELVVLHRFIVGCVGPFGVVEGLITFARCSAIILRMWIVIVLRPIRTIILPSDWAFLR